MFLIPKLPQPKTALIPKLSKHIIDVSKNKNLVRHFPYVKPPKPKYLLAQCPFTPKAHWARGLSPWLVLFQSPLSENYSLLQSCLNSKLSSHAKAAQTQTFPNSKAPKLEMHPIQSSLSSKLYLLQHSLYSKFLLFRSFPNKTYFIIFDLTEMLIITTFI